MNKRFALAAVLLLGLSLIATGSAVAKDKANTEFDFHIGDSFLGGSGDVARAENRDTITLQGSGTFDTKNGKADGNGTFVHRNAAGIVGSGTWKAKRLLIFHDAGTNPGFPRTFHAGEAILLVRVVGHLIADPDSTVEFDAILGVDCELPGGPGTFEGVTLNAGFINFNTRVSGQTVFVARADD